jgi:hypothetical protein
LAPVEFREIIQYEKGVTLIDAASLQRDEAIREKQLQEAYESINEFIRRRATHPLSDSAKNYLGTVIVERARGKVRAAKKSGDQKASLLSEARELYNQAYKLFATRENELKDALSRMKKVYDPKTEKKEKERQTQLRQDYLQAQILKGLVLEETADTHPEGSAEAKEALGRAADVYETIYEKYRTRLAGLYARMYQGRCDQKLGKLTDALSYYAELLENPDSPDQFRVLKTRTLLLAMDAWLDPAQNKYAEAVLRGSEWVGKSRAADNRDPDWLGLRLKVARAYKIKADADRAENPRDASRSITEARKLATLVSRIPGEFQKPAREFLLELRGGESANTKDRPDPRNFLEAKTRGKEALDSIQTAGLIVQTVPGRLQTEDDETVKKELQQQLDEARKTLVEARVEAFDMFRIALQLADSDTELADINAVRYFLAYLYFTRGELLDAALMGEFVASRYPDSSGARQGARIALAAYLNMHKTAKAAGSAADFETRRVVKLAEFMANKWPDQPEGSDALSTLIPFTINAGDLEKAQLYLTRIPEDSPKRGESELMTGRAIWRKYLKTSSEIRELERTGNSDDPNLKTLRSAAEKLLASAQTVLASAIQRTQDDPVDLTKALATLSLAQAYLDNGQADQAVAMLENEKIGPLALVKSGHAATKGVGYAEETLKTALRGYIAALPTASDSEQVIAQAKSTMELLKAQVGASADGQKRLVGIYIALARDLERMVLLAPDQDAKKKLSQGFEAFLEQVGREATEFNVLNWVAETFYSLGRGFAQGGAVSAESKKYFEKASDNYQKIIDKGLAAGPLLTQVRLRMAMTSRELGKFNDAETLFTEILAEKAMTLNVQVEAARTYQMWATKEKTATNKGKLLNRAMRGSQPDKSTNKNVIWGWGKISQLTAQRKEFRDTFHEARYNIAKCRFESAKAAGSKKDKAVLMDSAARDITTTADLYPNLGGEKWRPRYDELLKQIQRAQGKTPSGLKKQEGLGG